MIEVNKMLLPTSHRLYCGRSNKVKYITIHSTGGNAPAINERKWFDNPTNTREASWHYVIDDKQCIQAIADNMEAWHSGSSEGNKNSISLEICEGGNRKETLERAARFTAQKLKEYNLNVSHLKRHYDWSKKSCPSIMMSNNWKGWSDFKNMVQKELDSLNKPKTPAWKLQSLEFFRNEGIQFDFDLWTEQIDEPMPAWAVFIFMERMYKKLK